MMLSVLVVCLLTVDVDVDTHVRPTKRFGCVGVQLIPIFCSLCFIYRQKFEACAKVSRKLTSLMLLLLSSLNRISVILPDARSYALNCGYTVAAPNVRRLKLLLNLTLISTDLARVHRLLLT